MKLTRFISGTAASLTACLAVGTVGATAASAGTSDDFELYETTIAEIRTAFAEGTLTCTELISGYLDRIEAYEDAGPAINSLITLNPDAM
ncbi:hypothetical protein PU560_01045, partial [Georgenia sp. 10Sc9-8]|nr:hypothetical protein [Georgenia halotolerans]